MICQHTNANITKNWENKASAEKLDFFAVFDIITMIHGAKGAMQQLYSRLDC